MTPPSRSSHYIDEGSPGRAGQIPEARMILLPIPGNVHGGILKQCELIWRNRAPRFNCQPATFEEPSD